MSLPDREKFSCAFQDKVGGQITMNSKIKYNRQFEKSILNNPIKILLNYFFSK